MHQRAENTHCTSREWTPHRYSKIENYGSPFGGSKAGELYVGSTWTEEDNVKREMARLLHFKFPGGEDVK